jgi:signal transduction histidine kinase
VGSRWAAGTLAVLVVLCSAGAVAATLVVGWSLEDALDAFVVTNLLIGLGFGLCGALIAWHRPSLPLGWLYGVGGLCQALSACCAPLAAVLQQAGAPEWTVRLSLTVFAWAWPLNIGVVQPLTLLLLPDGRLPSPRWRGVAVAVVATAPLFVAEVGLAPLGFLGVPEPYGALSGYDELSWLWTSSEVRWVVSLLIGVVSLVVRYRSGSTGVRRQLRWLLVAVTVLVLTLTPWSLVAGTPLVVLFAIPLLPAAIALSVLRHRMLDIPLVVSRSLTYAVLSGLVLAAYAALVAVLSGVVSALVVALGVLPLRVHVQRAVDRLLYGERADPLRVASRVSRSMAAGLEDTLEEMRAALRLPGVAVEVDGTVVAAAGSLAAPLERLPLAGGSLVVGLRRGDHRLDPADARVLGLLAGPLSVAGHATGLTKQLQTSRERIVLAREEERRRLRRDLHDGLGPLLTGVALSADTAANLATRSAEQTRAVLADVRSDTRTAIAEVRRIVEDLRPPVLDELGLLQALQARAERTERRSDGSALTVVLDAPSALPTLPAAVEVAAYRIVTEALTNAVRHSTARSVVVRVESDSELRLDVADDGLDGAAWRAGVGITGMRERVAELGGSCEVGPGPDGGRVQVRLPLGAP